MKYKFILFLPGYLKAQFKGASGFCRFRGFGVLSHRAFMLLHSATSGAQELKDIQGLGFRV